MYGLHWMTSWKVLQLVCHWDHACARGHQRLVGEDVLWAGGQLHKERILWWDPQVFRFSSWHHRPKVFKHYNQDRWPWSEWQILHRNTFTTSDFAVDAGMGSAHKTYMSVSLSHQWTTEQVITFLSINFRSNFSQKKIGMGWLDPGGVRKRAP